MKSAAETLLETAEAEAAAKRYTNGLELYTKTYRVAVADGRTDIAIICCRDIAAIYDRLQQLDDALLWINSGAELAHLDLVVAGGFIINRGVCLLKQHKFAEARQAFDTAASMVAKVPPRMRTRAMHALRDKALENRDVVKQILLAQAAGQEIGIVPDSNE